MFKGSLLAGVALAVLTVAVPAAAKTTTKSTTTTTTTKTSTTSTSTSSTSSTTSSISISSAPLEQFSGSVGPFYGHIDPFYGSINPFYGSINPFYGRINPFYGQISPFWGSTTQFWGTINPFYGSINPFYGKIDPFWGTINPFYGSINPFYGTISPFWQSAGPQWGALNLEWANLQASSTSNYSSLQTQLNSFIASAQSFWGAAVQKATGKDFMSGFASAMLAKYGIDPNNPASLANVDAATRSAFFLNWYDGLMNYAGVDHVDWWMGAVHWTPQLSQIENAGSQSIIGVLDTWFDAGKTYGPNLHFAGGYKYFVNDHGAEVASLIAAKQDGQGVMGVAPNSDVELYNPFDTTGTASWTDVLNGILTLHNKGAAVINASLGVPGWTLSSDWASIFANPTFVKGKAATIIVKAAGNEGVAQTANVTWQSAQVPSDLLIVGSVDPDGNISSFSNTPGNACIMVSGVCDKLMNHFLVAPGENILVEDSSGNLSRASGTSFAAPLVTGAVALLQDRWPWLQQHSAETVQIILQSATDLGAPGVDPVYGWGELNIQASQSPLNFDNLIVYQPYSSTSGPGAAGAGPAVGSGSGNIQASSANWTAASLKSSLLNPGKLNLRQQNSAYIVAFENIGTTYRDFEIPLSSLLVGQTQKGNAKNPFQSYLYQRLIDWAQGKNSAGFSSQTVGGHSGDWDLSIQSIAATPDEMQYSSSPFHSEFTATNRDNGLRLRVGEGSGAYALAGEDSGFAMRSDFDTTTGGVNPVLGLASGGAYAQGSFALGDAVRLSMGYSTKSDNHEYIDPTFGAEKMLNLPVQHTSASVVSVNYAVSNGLKLNASYTELNEADGLLGSQGQGAFAMNGGTKTGAATVGFTLKVADWMVSGSATAAKSTAPNFGQSIISIANGSLTSTAYELAAEKHDLFSEADDLRLTVAQPLQVESGSLNYNSLQVVDRTTGAMGPIKQNWSLSGSREYRMEATYGVSVLDGRARLEGYALVDMNAPQAIATGATSDLAVGTRLQLDMN